MVTKNRSKNKLKIKLFLVLGGVFLFCIYILIAPRILSFKKEISSKNYLVEGWVSTQTLEKLADNLKEKEDYRVFISGSLFAEERIPSLKRIPVKGMNAIFVNGMMYLSKPKDSKCDSYILGLRGEGKTIDGYSSFYTISSNRNIVASGFLPLEGSIVKFYEILDTTDVLTISFINDTQSGKEDRNLYAKVLTCIDETLLNDSIDFALVSGINKDSGYGSQTAKVKDYLIHLGIPEARITEIVYQGSKRNLTWDEAKASCEFFQRKYKSLKDLIIITEKWHSLRSYIAYRRLNNSNKVNIGVLYYDHDINTDSKTCKEKVFSILDETVSTLVTFVYPKF